MKKLPCRGETSKMLQPDAIEHNIFYSDTYDNNMTPTFVIYTIIIELRITIL